MCGITGVVRFDGRPVDRDRLGRMVDALAHRGPDARGAQLLGEGSLHVGLGHARLRVVDLSEAAGQPMASDDGRVWVAFNGEIYNFRELRASLEARGQRFRTASDTEVLLRLYEADGERCVQALDGMFAFAIWDGRQRRLLLARDRLGKKPLFYCASPQMVAFASEIKALLRHPDIAPQVNTGALPSLFLYGYVPTPQTCYAGILKLPPGHLLRAGDDGHVEIEEYWDVPLADAPRRTAGEAEAAADIRELVTAAVRRRLIADVPLGAFLSGGIDSTIVVGIMSRLLQEPVRTFSIGFSGDARFDERAYARLAARRFQTVHTEFMVEPSSVDLIERLVWHHDGPFADSSAIPTYLLSRLTRQHVTVALNGDGGDELFAGYLRFYAAVAAEAAPRWARRMGGRLLGGLPDWGGHRSALARLRKFAGSVALPFAERFTRWVSVFYEDVPRLLPDAWHGAPARPLGPLEPSLQRCRGRSPLTQLLYLNLKTYLLDDLLVKMDRCSMAHGLEARSPFLDLALLEYAFSLPDAMKLRWGRTKVVLRRAFADLVPEPILRRGKMGFGVPLRAWFTTDLRDYLREVLLAPEARLRGYVEQSYVRALCEAHLAGRADHSHRLWTLLTFEVWLRDLSLGAGSFTWADAPEPAAMGGRLR